MPKMPAVVSKKVGPLPLWGWLVAGGAAVFVVLKMRGASGGSAASAGPGTIALPALASGGQLSDTGGLSTAPIVSPNQNLIGGMDTAPVGAAPWWATMPNPFAATQGIPLLGNPSTNGSAGSGSLTTPTAAAPSASAPSASWFSKLVNPMGNIPAGASVTSVGGTVYSLSDAALGRAGIAGAVPIQPAVTAAPSNASAPTNQTNVNRYELV